MCTTAFALIRFRNTISLKPHLKNNNIGFFGFLGFFLGILDIILADGEIKLVTEYKYKAKGPPVFPGCLHWKSGQCLWLLKSLNVVRNDKHCCRGGERSQNHTITTSEDLV